MTTPNLDISHVSGSQDNKEVTINLAFDDLDNATQSSLSVAVSADVSLSAAQFQSAFRFSLTGSPGASFVVQLPREVSRFFAVSNETGQTAVIEVQDGGSNAVSVADGTTVVLYSDGSDVLSISAASGGAPTQYYDLPCSFAGTPDLNEVMGRIIIPRTVTLATDFSGSSGYVETVPDVDVTVEVRVDGTSVGSVFIDSYDVFTFETDSAGPVVISPGSRVEFVCVNVDTQVTGIAFTLAGTTV